MKLYNAEGIEFDVAVETNQKELSQMRVTLKKIKQILGQKNKTAEQKIDAITKSIEVHEI